MESQLDNSPFDHLAAVRLHGAAGKGRRDVASPRCPRDVIVGGSQRIVDGRRGRRFRRVGLEIGQVVDSGRRDEPQTGFLGGSLDGVGVVHAPDAVIDDRRETAAQRLEEGPFGGDVCCFRGRRFLERHPYPLPHLGRLAAGDRLGEGFGDMVMGIDEPRHDRPFLQANGWDLRVDGRLALGHGLDGKNLAVLDRHDRIADRTVRSQNKVGAQRVRPDRTQTLETVGHFRSTRSLASAFRNSPRRNGR